MVNQREIKYRAYNKGNPTVVISGGADMEINAIFEQSREDLIWLQFTGLKDINGKEIYVNDIVNIYGFFQHCIVRFGKYQRRRWRNSDYPQEHYGFYLEGIPYKSKCGIRNDENISIIQESEFEVIGNIYEDKELLK